MRVQVTGHTFYGKPCRVCQSTERYIRNRACVACMRRMNCAKNAVQLTDPQISNALNNWKRHTHEFGDLSGI